MLTSEFSKEGLESAFRRVDNGHYEFARNHHHRRLYIGDIANKIRSGTFGFSHIKKKTIRNFYAYRTSKLGDELVLRRLTAIVCQGYRIKQADRTAIVKQVVSLIEEGVPKYILRLDIATFYETIDRKKIVEKIREDRRISNYSLTLLEKFFDRLTTVLPHGLPRGMGLSAALSELYLADLDKKIRQAPGVYYFARYVDDIIIFLNSHPAELQNNIEKWLPTGMTLNKNKCLSFHVGCRCTNLCIHQPNPCPCSGKKCVCKPAKDKDHELDYVGYRINFSDIITDGRSRQTNTIGISEKKIKRIKSRIIWAILAYRGDHNFDLLYQRIRFLTENHTLKAAMSKGNLKTGIRYNYHLITDKVDLKNLDVFLRNILSSSKTAFGLKLHPLLDPAQRAALQKLSFVSGFSANRSRRLSSTLVKTIRRCWKHA